MGEPLVLVNFFASWCAPCLVEHPLLTRLSSRVPVYGVAWRDEPADTRTWLATHGNPYHGVSLDPESTIGLEFGVYGVPETFFIDHTRPHPVSSRGAFDAGLSGKGPRDAFSRAGAGILTRAHQWGTHAWGTH